MSRDEAIILLVPVPRSGELNDFLKLLEDAAKILWDEL